jgi:hypothetical protein
MGLALGARPTAETCSGIADCRFSIFPVAQRNPMLTRARVSGLGKLTRMLGNGLFASVARRNRLVDGPRAVDALGSVPEL